MATPYQKEITNLIRGEYIASLRDGKPVDWALIRRMYPKDKVEKAVRYLAKEEKQGRLKVG